VAKGVGGTGEIEGLLQVRCSDAIANFPQNVAAKKFLKSVSIW